MDVCKHFIFLERGLNAPSAVITICESPDAVSAPVRVVISWRVPASILDCHLYRALFVIRVMVCDQFSTKKMRMVISLVCNLYLWYPMASTAITSLHSSNSITTWIFLLPVHFQSYLEPACHLHDVVVVRYAETRLP